LNQDLGLISSGVLTYLSFQECGTLSLQEDEEEKPAGGRARSACLLHIYSSHLSCFTQEEVKLSAKAP
jgi:hypothetical protein